MADVRRSHYLQGSGKISKEAASLEEAPISYQGWIPEFDGDGQHGPLMAKYLAELSLQPNTLGFQSLGCWRKPSMGKCHAVGFIRKLPLGHRGSTHGKSCRLLAMVSLSRGRSYGRDSPSPSGVAFNTLF